jgi:hypothetical protein
VLVLEIRCQSLLEVIRTIWCCYLYIICNYLILSYLMCIWLCPCLINVSLLLNVFLLLCLIVRLCTYCIFMYLLYVYIFIVCLCIPWATLGARPAFFPNFCVVLCIVCFVSFCALFVCKCLLTTATGWLPNCS